MSPGSAHSDAPFAPAAGRAGVRYTAGDIAALLWRRIPLMLVVFVLVAGAGGLVALRMKESFTARSSLLVRLGQSYVYEPRVGDAARGAAPDNDQVVQSELEILQSQAVKERVIRDVGLGRLFPALGHAWARAGEAQRRLIEGQAIKGMEQALKVQAAPDNAVVKLTYASADGETAALVLNTLVDEYLRYRPSVLVDRNLGSITTQRERAQSGLAAVEAAFQTFLSENRIGDFDSEKSALSQIYSQLLIDSYSVDAQLSETGGRLGVTAKNAAAAPAETALYRDIDHGAQDKLLQLRIDRQDLLSRYVPTALPVRELDQKIAALEALIQSGQAQGQGARRVGANPVQQALVTEKHQLEAQGASLKGRKAMLASELAQVTARRQRLAALEPRYQDLVRQRDLLSNSVKAFSQREQDGKAAEALAEHGDDAVKVIERAYPSAKGVSLQKPVLILSLLFAAFTALCAGLLSAFLARGYPTEAAIERELDLPVLASARLKAA